MSNTNCLAGISCPVCGSEESFKAYTTCMMVWVDDGTEEGDDHEMVENGACICIACNHHGIVADFKDGDI